MYAIHYAVLYHAYDCLEFLLTSKDDIVNLPGPKNGQYEEVFFFLFLFFFQRKLIF